jgi:predicted peptidase
MIIAGVVYTWYMGQQKPVVEASMPPKITSGPIIKHVAPADKNPVGVAVQALMSPVAPGDNSYIQVKTNPNANCTIKVEYNEVATKDSGLISKTADEYGAIMWSWTVDKTAPDGKWPVTVTCAKGKLSGVVVGKIQVKK